MCLLCLISRWSRRIATMLPWLVIPFIIVWALSQLLPPSYRLEVTSSRLACLGVLLSSLVWYEILMPWLSSWRAQRSARQRERKLIEAQEAAKWRKEATRRCRNCFTAYKVQTPGSGRFVCTYCGHMSKRPVLEVPRALASLGPVGLPTTVSAAWGSGSGMRQLRSADQAIGHAITVWSRTSERNRCAWFDECLNGPDRCSAGAYSFPLLFIMRWLVIFWRKLLGLGQSAARRSRNLHRTSDARADFYGSREEKARRKAAKKKQARLQKELLEAEDRKQREEVALLVEEQRRQREEFESAKQKEMKAAAERLRDTRTAQYEERRQIDKAKKPVILGQGHAAEAKLKTKRESGDKGTIAKMSRGVQDQGLRHKITTENFLKFGLLKRTTNGAQKVPGTTLKTGTSFQGDGFGKSTNDGAHAVGNATKSNTGSSPSAKAVEAPHVPSAWKRGLSAWVKGSSSKMQTESVIDSGKGVDRIIDGGLKSSNIIRPSVSPVRGTAIQPPRATPSAHIDPVQQLFSTPSLFSPLDLSGDLKTDQLHRDVQHETKGFFLPEHTFFEAHSHTLSSDSFALPFASLPIQMPMLAMDMSGGMGRGFMQSNTARSEHCMPSETVNGAETACAGRPTSVFSSSGTSHSNIDGILIPSSLLGPLKGVDSNQCLDKGVFLPWENTDDVALQLPPLSTVQSLFDSEMLMPDACLRSPQKFTTYKVDDDVLLDGIEGLDKTSFWSDMSVNVDDTDNSQKVPAEFVDCITQEIMEDPVITADGHSYERNAIEKWLKHHDTSPKTGEVLPPPPGSTGVDKTLRPNHILRGQIIEYKEKLTRVSGFRANTWSMTTTRAGSIFKMASAPSVLSF